jgi:hypothetical protein
MHAGRRRLHLEVEGAVLVDRDQHADDLALQRAGCGVEALDELPGVHAVLAEGRADRRRGVAVPPGPEA